MSLDARLVKVADADSVTGWTTQIKAAQGSSVPLSFSAIKYAGQTPATASGIAFKLLVKTNRTDADGDALTELLNADLAIATSPLVVGASIDTTAAGYVADSTVYGELWADDSTYGKHLVSEFQLKLSDPIRASFA